MPPLKANFDKGYLWRYWVIIIMCFGGTFWFAYDGFIGYPHKLQIAEEYARLAGMEPTPKSEKWKEITTAKGWPSEVPDPHKTPEIIRQDIRFQFIYAAVGAVLGTFALLYMLMARVSWVEETENGLKTSWGQSVDFATVTLLNKRKWKEKGIARVDYLDNGRKRQFVFDDFKFEREPLGKLLQRLESNLSADKILDGPVTAESDADPEADDASSNG